MTGTSDDLLPILDVVRILRLPSSQALWNMINKEEVFPVMWDKGSHAIPRAALVDYLQTALEKVTAARPEDPITSDSPYDYIQAAYGIRGKIDSGTLKPGDRLPVRQTADDCGVSPDSIRKALILLAKRGYVRQQVGTGWFVTRRDSD
jgi:Bacterial regulatory proteins, gntR family